MACVYKHIRLDKNEPFYIGMGNTISRAYSKKKRNKHWWNIVNKTEYKIHLLKNNISWWEALYLEVFWIKYYGRTDLKTGPLVNKTNGGRGTIGSIRPDLTLYNKTRINPLKGIKRPVEFGQNLSKLKKGIPRPDVTLKLKGTKRGKMPWISESNMKRKGLKKTCPYCFKIGGSSRFMNQNHFENCHKKPFKIDNDA